MVADPHPGRRPDAVGHQMQDGGFARTRRHAEMAQAGLGERRPADRDRRVQVGDRRPAGRLYFRPRHARFWTFEEGLVPTSAKVCAACGYVQLHADPAKLDRIRSKEDTRTNDDDR